MMTEPARGAVALIEAEDRERDRRGAALEQR
jgi:hypothetical protein